MSENDDYSLLRPEALVNDRRQAALTLILAGFAAILSVALILITIQ